VQTNKLLKVKLWQISPYTF